MAKHTTKNTYDMFGSIKSLEIEKPEDTEPEIEEAETEPVVKKAPVRTNKNAKIKHMPVKAAEDNTPSEEDEYQVVTRKDGTFWQNKRTGELTPIQRPGMASVSTEEIHPQKPPVKKPEDIIQIGERTFKADELKDEEKKNEYIEAVQNAARNGEMPVIKKEKLNLSRRYQRADMEWDYVRQTYYMTPEEICAISRIAYQENCKKSDLLRQLLDSALEEYYPGILEDVAEEAQRLRDDRSHPTRRYGVPE